ncbi:hypothetical protein FB451DRAFT_1570875 [Mycena latifolia]|nr:hypothetical protein FB451DRAFT_1570875 [Mycena latifolia]
MEKSVAYVPLTLLVLRLPFGSFFWAVFWLPMRRQYQCGFCGGGVDQKRDERVKFRTVALCYNSYGHCMIYGKLTKKDNGAPSTKWSRMLVPKIIGLRAVFTVLEAADRVLGHPEQAGWDGGSSA